MDLTIILALVSGAVIIVLFFFVFYKFGKGIKSVPEQDENESEIRRGVGGPRGARARMRAAQQRQQQPQAPAAGGGDGDDDEDDEDAQLKKMGAKKAAKLEAKAEKKAMREAEEREREEKKKRKEQAEEERKRQEEKEEEAERKREEEERKAKEEEERREYEEYLKMKAAFSVEEEGYDETEIPEGSDALNDFITYIQDMKVVSLEDVAAKFHMRTKSAIERIQELESQGRLTGVIDDRGKFIYISQQELEGIAKFVKQRGRVSLVELAESSNKLINLTPKISVET